MFSQSAARRSQKSLGFGFHDHGGELAASARVRNASRSLLAGASPSVEV